ncbi:MAG: NAD(P)H nitroreductase [Bacteroidetes bacterium]|nr:MAG: NAD(P)H nitroreductase [Bacteroidota bacterium]
MNFSDLAKKRQSVRSYKDMPVEREKIERCIEAARIAPSAHNVQPWKFIVIDDEELKNKVAKETFNSIVSFNKFTLKAPVLIVVITEKPKLVTKIAGAIKKTQFNLVDIGIAVEHFCLQAVEENLGTCILGWFFKKGVKKALNIPQNEDVDIVIALGYPKTDTIREKRRKNIDEIRAYNKYF